MSGIIKGHMEQRKKGEIKVEKKEWKKIKENKQWEEGKKKG